MDKVIGLTYTYTKPDEPQTPVLSAPESQWYL